MDIYKSTEITVHKLNELNEKKLLELENRKDGEVEILDVRLNNRKTKTTNKKDEYQNPTDKIKLKKEHSISSLINEKISTSNPTKISNEADNNKLSVKNSNGAGDALMAGLVHGHLKDWSWDYTVKFAISSGICIPP